MDGVLHQHGNLIPGAGDFLEDLLEQSVPFTIITNECRYTGDALQEKLRNILGVKIPLGQIYTAANSVRDFFSRMVRKGWKGNVFVIGEDGLTENVRDAFAESESRVITGQDYAGEHCDFVCIGTVITGGPNDKWTNAELASTLIRNGAKLLYTNPDWGEVTADGSYKFGCPAPIVKLLTQITGCSAYNLGKPNPFGLRRAHSQLVSSLLDSLSTAQRAFVSGNIEFSDVLFVGDSIDTDIRVAIENGIDSALVLSGTTTLSKLQTSALRPNYVFDCVSGLHAEFKRGGLQRGGGNFKPDAFRSDPMLDSLTKALSSASDIEDLTKALSDAETRLEELKSDQVPL
jgi:HAD superfamily hydrolase (TIGR01450 family)